jgi:hypothetical protein
MSDNIKFSNTTCVNELDKVVCSKKVMVSEGFVNSADVSTRRKNRSNAFYNAKQKLKNSIEAGISAGSAKGITFKPANITCEITNDKTNISCSTAVSSNSKLYSGTDKEKTPEKARTKAEKNLSFFKHSVTSYVTPNPSASTIPTSTPNPPSSAPAPPAPTSTPNPRASTIPTSTPNPRASTIPNPNPIASTIPTSDNDVVIFALDFLQNQTSEYIPKYTVYVFNENTGYTRSRELDQIYIRLENISYQLELSEIDNMQNKNAYALSPTDGFVEYKKENEENDQFRRIDYRFVSSINKSNYENAIFFNKAKIDRYIRGTQIRMSDDDRFARCIFPLIDYGKSVADRRKELKPSFVRTMGQPFLAFTKTYDELNVIKTGNNKNKTDLINLNDRFEKYKSIITNLFYSNKTDGGRNSTRKYKNRAQKTHKKVGKKLNKSQKRKNHKKYRSRIAHR